MLRSLKDLENYRIHATDGDIGHVRDFLLDDERWAVRYLVVQTAPSFFLDEHRVLISPVSFRQADWSTHRFHLALTMAKVKNAPNVDLDKPVSRQHERDYYRYHGYPYYWGYPGLWGVGAYPSTLALDRATDAPDDATDEPPGDAHLRSAQEVRGYHVEGSDDTIGHVEDFIVDDQSWQVRYLVIDTSNYWFGKKVLVAPHWATRVSWTDRKVHIDMSRKAIKSSPTWNAAAPINREYETRLYDAYGRPVYWGSAERTEGDHSSY